MVIVMVVLGVIVGVMVLVLALVLMLILVLVTVLLQKQRRPSSHTAALQQEVSDCPSKAALHPKP